MMKEEETATGLEGEAQVPPADTLMSQLSDEERRILTNPKFRWYIVNTYSGSEETVRVALRERIVRSGMEGYFGEIFVPKTVVEKILKSGKKKQVDKTTFPGYIMIQMEINDESMGCVSATPKVTGFVGDKRRPKPMSDADVLRLLNPALAKQEAQATQVIEASFEKGEKVKVVDGPFNKFDGVIEEVKPEKMKLRVLVSIFGRETPVDLSYNQVEKLD